MWIIFNRHWLTVFYDLSFTTWKDSWSHDAMTSLLPRMLQYKSVCVYSLWVNVCVGRYLRRRRSCSQHPSADWNILDEVRGSEPIRSLCPLWSCDKLWFLQLTVDSARLTSIQPKTHVFLLWAGMRTNDWFTFQTFYFRKVNFRKKCKDLIGILSMENKKC